jgi:serine/threonine protein kinase
MYEKKFSVESSILLSYQPQPIQLFKEKYKTDKKIYDQDLFSTYVYIGTDEIENSKVAIKQIKKKRMDKSYLHEMARNELAVHYSLSRTKCNNIVNAKNYFEDDISYYLVMECSPEPNFFEDMLENVR